MTKPHPNIISILFKIILLNGSAKGNEKMVVLSCIMAIARKWHEYNHATACASHNLGRCVVFIKQPQNLLYTMLQKGIPYLKYCIFPSKINITFFFGNNYCILYSSKLILHCGFYRKDVLDLQTITIYSNHIGMGYHVDIFNRMNSFHSTWHVEMFYLTKEPTLNCGANISVAF